MKRAKNIAIIYALTAMLLMTGANYGQSVERTSDKRVVVSDVIVKLQGSVSWRKQLGQWESGSGEYGDMELRSMDLDGTNYMILTVRGVEMKYRVPEFKIGLYLVDILEHFLIDKEKLAKLLPATVELNKAYAVDMEPVIYTTGIMDVGSQFHFAVERFKTKPDKTRNITIGVFPVTYEGKKMVRYIINKGNELGDKAVFEKTEFDSSYYEIPYDTFYRFTRLIEEPVTTKKKKDKDKDKKN